MKKKIEFTHANFAGAALDSKYFPQLSTEQGHLFPEIAIAGRSNVGKSSLINHLTATPGLAHVSSSPGKTQTINFYNIEDQLALVDLPGYGYAKVPHKMRKDWGSWISLYFLKRQPLRGVILLLDIRRIPCEEDIAMAAWATKQKKSLLFVFTKTDKTTPHEQNLLSKAALQKFSPYCLDIDTFPPIFYSIREKTGREHLIRVLNTLLNLSH